MKKQQAKQWQALLSILKTAFEQGKGEELLTLLLTLDERESIGLRLQIVAQLLEGAKPQREIVQDLNTSAATITRGSNMIKTMPEDFLEWVKKELNH